VERLLSAFEAVTRGEGNLVLLAGEPGAGKTRLAQEVMVHAFERGVRIVVGRCYAESASLPFQPFREMLDAWFSGGESPTRDETMRRWPELARLLVEQWSGPPTAEADAEDARLRLQRAVAGFVQALAANTPLAVLLDDLQWADSASLRLLVHLARQLRGERILLLGTYRDVGVGTEHPLESALRELVHERLVEEVALSRLVEAGTAALMQARLGSEHVADDLVSLVHARTDSNPFFAEEVLKALVECGDVYRRDGQWERRGEGELEVPRNMRSAIRQRVGRLEPEALELLRVAATLGQEFDLDVLLATAGRTEAGLLEHVDSALTERLLEARGTGPGQVRYVLIQQALYEEQPPC
jgi:predicted ATPase